MSCDVDDDKDKLYIIGLFALSKAKPYPAGEAFQIAAQVAVEDINNRTDVLPDFHLELDVVDTQISYSALSPTLSDKKLYPWFFRIMASENVLSNHRIELMKHFEWTHLSMLQESYTLFSAENDARIIYFASYEDKARNACCTVIEGYFTVQNINLDDNVSETISLNADEYRERYRAKYESSRHHIPPVGSDRAPLAYDSMWAIALALNTTEQELRQNGTSLKNFTNTDRWMGEMIKDNMKNVSFVGLSGEVSFNVTNDRKHYKIAIRQFQKNATNRT
nr:hypothetical protein BaRGS_018782 [Batillaria attramentaria]